MQFDEFFFRATGNRPHPFQQRVADQGLPDLLQVPMGCGKSRAVVVAWLWRRLFADTHVRAATPRRLVVALPMRTLVDQFERDIHSCLAAVDLMDLVAVHVVMGGNRSNEHLWRMESAKPSIMVGTVDCLVSKALNRGYGISRGLFPMDFALVTNGAHLVIDEIQLAPASAATLRQLAGFQREYGTAEPVGLTCMSATVHPDVMDTIDNPATELHKITLDESDHAGHLGKLLAATRIVRRVPAPTPDDRAIAELALSRHRPGHRTLVVANTVRSARLIFAALQKTGTEVPRMLIHSRFRGVERAQLAEQLIANPGTEGLVVVATQVIEAGVDIDSAVLITEAPSWPSLCQRSGRVNRYAAVDAAELWWFPARPKGPYDPAETADTEVLLGKLEGEACTGTRLLAQPAKQSNLALRILRRPELLALFDTAPDLSGSDVNIAPYIRDADDDLDCHVAWIDPPADGSLLADYPVPPPEWRCSVPVNQVREWRGGARQWVFDVVRERWERVNRQTRIRPGELILAHAADGGYDARLGFDATAKTPVIIQEPLPAVDGAVGGPAAEESDAMSTESTNIGAAAWLSLDDHLRQARDQAAALVECLAPSLPNELCAAVVAAALVHDCGKVHPAWQQALRGTAEDPPNESELLAKSPGHGRMLVSGRRGFRHELVSALLLGHPNARNFRQACGIDEANLALVRYLAAAHHGKVRVQARQPSDSVAVDPGLLGVRTGDVIPGSVLMDTPIAAWPVDLGGFAFGAEQSWTDDALRLRDTYGPFVLAYLELLVRIADWRASGRLPLPGASEVQTGGRP